MAALTLGACFPLPGPGDQAFDIRCPVNGTVSFSDDWHAARSGGTLHEGNDVFSARWTPNVAVVDGRIVQRTGTRSGTAVWLYGDDGHDYFYAHFQAWEGVNRTVQAGDVIGYTGNSGDASGTATHTHFEIHPNGGAAVNPYASLSAACTNRKTTGVSSASSTEVGTERE